MDWTSIAVTAQSSTPAYASLGSLTQKIGIPYKGFNIMNLPGTCCTTNLARHYLLLRKPTEIPPKSGLDGHGNILEGSLYRIVTQLVRGTFDSRKR